MTKRGRKENVCRAIDARRETIALHEEYTMNAVTVADIGDFMRLCRMLKQSLRLF